MNSPQVYIVEMAIGDGWENVWRYDAGEHNPEGTPQTFESVTDAIDAIKDHIKDCINAVEGGDMEDSPDPSEFRIMREGVAYEYTSGMDWQPELEELSFMHYWEDVDAYFQALYGVDTTDIGMSADEVANAQENGDNPREFVEWFGRKHDLTLKTEWTMEQSARVMKRFIKKEE